MRRLGKFLRLSNSERWSLAESLVLLGIARLALLMMPFRYLEPFLGMHMAESPNTANPYYRDLVERVSWAVRTASRYLPWECTCLAQAMAGKSMLKRRGVQSTLYLGVAKDSEKNLKAHAWLRSGNVTVIGSQGMDQFSVISTFT